MPIRIRVDPARRVSYTTATGVITDADLREVCASMLANPDYDPSADHLFDGNGIERLEVTPATVQEAAQLFASADHRISTGACPRVAIVAPADATFGVARMYEAYREMQPSSPKRYLVCRTMEEARRWLGLPEEEPAEPAYDATALDVGTALDVECGPRIVPVEFDDPHGVRWAVVPRLLGSGEDVVPHGFVFSSERGERRFLRWDPKDFFSPREIGHATWRELLRSATVVT
jgi:hypothetical protein